jgi:hypothetical protein
MQISMDSLPVTCSFAADEADAYCSIVRSFRTGDMQPAGCKVDMYLISARAQLQIWSTVNTFSRVSCACRPTLGCEAAHEAALGDVAGAALAMHAAE